MRAFQQFAVADAAAGDINSTVARPEVAVEWPDQGSDLPDQGGGARRTTLAPGIYAFKLPESLVSLWHEVEVVDRRAFLGNGQPNPTFNQKVKRSQLKFDRNAPLIVVGGPHDGEPMTASFSSAPRPRSFKKDASKDPATPWISDLAYLLDIALADKSRPSNPEALKATINKYAGRTIRLETGLTAQCRADKVRYIRVETVEGNERAEQDLQDPTGKKGCGKRFNTKDFKDPATGKYDLEIACVCGDPTQDEVNAGVLPATVIVRAFEQVERFLPPLGS